MDDAVTILVVSVLLAFLARIFWREILNLVLIMGISLIFVAILFVVLGVERLSNWT
jgi:uncharacterized membrane protein